MPGVGEVLSSTMTEFERRLNEQRERAFREKLDIPFDPTGEVTDLGARFQAARITRENLAEQALAIRKSLNLSERDVLIVEDPEEEGKPTIIVRPPGEDKYVTVDLFSGSTMADLADVAGSMTNFATLGQMIGSALAARLPGIGFGLTALTRLGIAGTTTAAGYAVDSELDRLLEGGELTPRDEIYTRGIRREFTLGAAGEIPGMVASSIRGRGRQLTSNRALELLNQEIREAFPGGEISELTAVEFNPIWRTLEKQSAMVHAGTREARMDRLSRFAQELVTMSKDMSPDISEDALEAVLNKWQEQIIRETAAPIRGNVVKGATFLRRALKELDNLNTRLLKTRREAMNRVIRREDISYNISLPQKIIDRARRGVVGRGPEEPAILGDVVEQASRRAEEAAGLAPREEALSGALTDEQIQKLEQIVGPEGLQQFRDMTRAEIVIEPVSKKLRDIASRFTELDPRLTRFVDSNGNVQSPFDLLISFQNQVRPFLDSSVPRDREFARLFMNVLDGVLRRPTGRLSPAYNRALRRYTSVVAQREKMLERLSIREMIRALGSDPSKMARSFIDPTRPERVHLARSIFNKSGKGDQFKVMGQAYQAELMRSISTIERELGRWTDQRAKRLLISEADEKSLIELSRRWRRLEKSSFFRLAAMKKSFGRKAVDAILSADDDLLQELIERAGGLNSDIGQAIQFGIFMDIVDRSTATELGKQVIKPDRAIKLIDDLKRTGRLETVMSPANRRRLDVMGRALSFLPGSIGMGEGLLGATAASNLFSVPLSNRFFRGLGTLVRAELLSSFFFNVPEGTIRSWVRKQLVTPRTVRQPFVPTAIGMLGELLARGIEASGRTAEEIFPSTPVTTPVNPNVLQIPPPGFEGELEVPSLLVPHPEVGQ